MPRTLFTSDPHFFHKNVIQYGKRPWPDVDAMNYGIVERWNRVAAPDDIVYVLGDMALNGKKAIEFVKMLNGRKRLIRGNHDHDIVKKGAGCFEWIRDYYEATIDMPPGYEPLVDGPMPKVVLFHFPIEVWNNKHKGWLHFHGHSHGNLRRTIKGRVDVGMDCWDWTPVTYEQARERALSYAHVVDDHHNESDPR